MVSLRFGPLTRTAQLVRVLITEPIGPFLVFQLEDWGISFKRVHRRSKQRRRA